MPLQNRVTPDGEIVAHSARGLFFGNRGGRIHDPATRTLLPRRRWVSKRWICCVLAFRGRQRRVMGPGYTELFFLDEATALAAGHRPCFECRRADARAFAAHWQAGHGLSAPPMADDMDTVLHGERLNRTDPLALPASLPSGAMVADDKAVYAMRDGSALIWGPDGYRAATPPKIARIITPPAIIRVLESGYRPAWHPTAGAV